MVSSRGQLLVGGFCPNSDENTAGLTENGPRNDDDERERERLHGELLLGDHSSLEPTMYEIVHGGSNPELRGKHLT